MSLRRFEQLIGWLSQRMAAFPDRRTGRNKKYTMGDIAWYFSSENIHGPHCSRIEH